MDNSLNFTTFAFYPNLSNVDDKWRVRREMLAKYNHCKGDWPDYRTNIQFKFVIALKSAGSKLNCVFSEGSADFAQEFIEARFSTGCYVSERSLPPFATRIPKYPKNHCSNHGEKRKLQFFCSNEDSGCRTHPINGLSVRLEIDRQICTCDPTKWHLRYSKAATKVDECTEIVMINSQTNETKKFMLIPDQIQNVDFEMESKWTTDVEIQLKPCENITCTEEITIEGYSKLSLFTPALSTGYSISKDLIPIECDTVSIITNDLCGSDLSDDSNCRKRIISVHYDEDLNTFEKSLILFIVYAYYII